MTDDPCPAPGRTRDGKFTPGNEAGKATRFQPGHKAGHRFQPGNTLGSRFQPGHKISSSRNTRQPRPGDPPPPPPPLTPGPPAPPFHQALQEHFSRYGLQVLDEVLRTRPLEYLKLCGALLPRAAGAAAGGVGTTGGPRDPVKAMSDVELGRALAVLRDEVAALEAAEVSSAGQEGDEA